MTWRDVALRVAPWYARVRSGLTLRGLGRWIAGFTALGLLVIMGEAAFRARLASPEDRVTTALYTRPVPWGERRARAAPVLLASVHGGPSEQRQPVSLARVPPVLVDAVLAVEDQRFRQHAGLDVRRIAGAALANARSRQIVQGGSTITQQLAKNLFLTHERTPLRKLREAAMALVLEQHYDKDTILEAYLNEIYLGQDGPRPIHGVGAAARVFFGKSLEDLDLGEAALLAGMIRAPNRYSPIRRPDVARERRDLVLRLMLEQGRVKRGAVDRAQRARIRVRSRSTDAIDGRYFRDVVLRDVGRLPSRGVAVYTTLDARLQRAAEQAVRSATLPQGAQAALVALDPEAGDLLALVGGRDYGASQFNRATDARRQPGSAFKPVVALAALSREGRRAPAYTLASVVPDEPISIVTPAGRWEPRNYDRAFRGPVTLREAMEQSLNVPFARIGADLGPERIVRTARRLGIASPLRAVPSLALGSSEVTLYELTRAYGVFAAGGRLARPRAWVRVERGGGAADVGPSPPAAVVDPAEAYLVTSALEGVVARGTGHAIADWRWSGGIAAKSGTSNEWRDAWFIAFTPSLVVGAWVGFDDGRSLRLTGAQAALPLVSRFLSEAFRANDPAPFPVPDGVELARVDALGDGWDGGWCVRRTEVFLEGTAPERSRCHDLDVPERRHRVGEDWVALLEHRAQRLAERLLERFEEWGGRGRR